MITTTARLWIAIAVFAIVSGCVYFLATGGEDGGAITLLFIGLGALVIAGAGIATNDGDAATPGVQGGGPRSDSEVTLEAVVVRSALPAIWPVLGAIGAGITIVGYSSGGLILYAGFGVLVATLVEWMVQSWAERATADPAYNAALRNRIMYPIEVPAAGLLALGLVIITFSRVLLAVPKEGSIVIAAVVATLMVATAFFVVSRPKIPSGALAWVLAASAVVLLAAAVIGGVSGERRIGEHEGTKTESTHTPEDTPTEDTAP